MKSTHMLYRQNLLLGAGLILISEFWFAAMGAVVKAVSVNLPLEMLVFMRGLFGLLVLAPFLLRRLQRTTLTTQVFSLHLLRAALGLAAMYCFFFALANLQLADGMLLKMTAPLFMPLIAALWLGESLGPRIWLAVGVGFAGVALVLQPEADFNWAAVIGLGGGLFAAVAKVTVRRLGQTEPTLRIVFYFSLLVTLLASVPLLWRWQTPVLSDWLGLLAMGLFGTLGQLFLTRAYAVADAGRIAPFTYFSVLYAAALGYVFWQETLRLGFVAGASLISIAGIMALRRRHDASRVTGGTTRGQS